MLVTLNLFLAGLLAGEELIIRFGVRGPLAAMKPEAHVRLRQGLVLKMRVLVPSVLIPAVLTSVAVAALHDSVLRWAAVGAYAALYAFSEDRSLDRRSRVVGLAPYGAAQPGARRSAPSAA